MSRDQADLHVHSDRSDGVHPPAEIVRMAVDINLGGVALTDHDTTAGLQEFTETPAPDWLIRVPGIEISTDWHGEEVHLLGYLVPEHSPRLEKRLQHFREGRERRFPKMVERLRNLGIDLDEESVRAILENVESPGRPHLARLLVEAGVVRDINEAFERYLGEGRPAYVRREMIDLYDGVRLLDSVGAVPVLAHPLFFPVETIQGLLRELVELGLRGVEVEYAYPNSPGKDAFDALRRTARELGLIETGGSDYHDPESYALLGGVTVPIGTVDRLRQSSLRQ